MMPASEAPTALAQISSVRSATLLGAGETAATRSAATVAAGAAA
jgi:hypothetical protein